MGDVPIEDRINASLDSSDDAVEAKMFGMGILRRIGGGGRGGGGSLAEAIGEAFRRDGDGVGGGGGGGKRPAAYDPNAADADADGLVQEGTTQERPGVPGGGVPGGGGPNNPGGGGPGGGGTSNPGGTNNPGGGATPPPNAPGGTTPPPTPGSGRAYSPARARALYESGNRRNILGDSGEQANAQIIYDRYMATHNPSDRPWDPNYDPNNPDAPTVWANDPNMPNSGGSGPEDPWVDTPSTPEPEDLYPPEDGPEPGKPEGKPVVRDKEKEREVKKLLEEARRKVEARRLSFGGSDFLERDRDLAEIDAWLDWIKKRNNENPYSSEDLDQIAEYLDKKYFKRDRESDEWLKEREKEERERIKEEKERAKQEREKAKQDLKDFEEMMRREREGEGKPEGKPEAPPEATPEPTPEPGEPEPTPEETPTPEPGTPEATPEKTPEGEPEAAPEDKPEATPEPGKPEEPPEAPPEETPKPGEPEKTPAPEAPPEPGAREEIPNPEEPPEGEPEPGTPEETPEPEETPTPEPGGPEEPPKPKETRAQKRNRERAERIRATLERDREENVAPLLEGDVPEADKPEGDVPEADKPDGTPESGEPQAAPEVPPEPVKPKETATQKRNREMRERIQARLKPPEGAEENITPLLEGEGDVPEADKPEGPPNPFEGIEPPAERPEEGPNPFVEKPKETAAQKRNRERAERIRATLERDREENVTPLIEGETPEGEVKPVKRPPRKPTSGNDNEPENTPETPQDGPPGETPQERRTRRLIELREKLGLDKDGNPVGPSPFGDKPLDDVTNLPVAPPQPDVVEAQNGLPPIPEGYRRLFRGDIVDSEGTPLGSTRYTNGVDEEQYTGMWWAEDARRAEGHAFGKLPDGVQELVTDPRTGETSYQDPEDLVRRVRYVDIPEEEFQKLQTVNAAQILPLDQQAGAVEYEVDNYDLTPDERSEAISRIAGHVRGAEGRDPELGLTREQRLAEFLGGEEIGAELAEGINDTNLPGALFRSVDANGNPKVNSDETGVISYDTDWAKEYDRLGAGLLDGTTTEEDLANFFRENPEFDQSLKRALSTRSDRDPEVNKGFEIGRKVKPEKPKPEPRIEPKPEPEQPKTETPEATYIPQPLKIEDDIWGDSTPAASPQETPAATETPRQYAPPDWEAFANPPGQPQAAPEAIQPSEVIDQYQPIETPPSLGPAPEVPPIEAEGRTVPPRPPETPSTPEFDNEGFESLTQEIDAAISDPAVGGESYKELLEKLRAYRKPGNTYLQRDQMRVGQMIDKLIDAGLKDEQQKLDDIEKAQAAVPDVVPAPTTPDAVDPTPRNVTSDIADRVDTSSRLARDVNEREAQAKAEAEQQEQLVQSIKTSVDTIVDGKSPISIFDSEQYARELWVQASELMERNNVPAAEALMDHIQRLEERNVRTRNEMYPPKPEGISDPSTASTSKAREAATGLAQKVDDGLDAKLGGVDAAGFHLPGEVATPAEGEPGIHNAAEAKDHVSGGGALSEVPDDLLANSIVDNSVDVESLELPRYSTYVDPEDIQTYVDQLDASDAETILAKSDLDAMIVTERGDRKPTRPDQVRVWEEDKQELIDFIADNPMSERFLPIGGSDQGANGIQMFYDRETKQRIAIKYGNSVSTGIREDFSEMLGAHIAERFGFATSSFRWGAPRPVEQAPIDGVPIIHREYGVGNTGSVARPIVIELAQNSFGDDVSMGIAGQPTDIGADDLISMTLLDWTILNDDRHIANIMSTRDAEGRVSLIPIDHGMGFGAGFNPHDPQWTTLSEWSHSAEGGSRRTNYLVLEIYKRSGPGRDNWVETRAELISAIQRAQGRLRDADSAKEVSAAIAEIMYGAGADFTASESVSTTADRIQWILDTDPDSILESIIPNGAV